MKRTLAIISTAILIALLVIPVGTALADGEFHTIKVPISLTGEGAIAGHTLTSGWVMRTNTEGPVNYYVERYLLNGAKPNTTYDIGFEFEAVPGVVFTSFIELTSIQTNENGNGLLSYRNSPDMVANIYPNTTREWRCVFIEGGTRVPVAPGWWIIYGGTRAFETEMIEFHFDWD